MYPQSRNKHKKDCMELVKKAMYERYLVERGSYEELTLYVDRLKDAERAVLDERGVNIDLLSDDPVVKQWVYQTWGEEF